MPKSPLPPLSVTGIAFASLSLTGLRGETEPPFRLITLDPGHFLADKPMAITPADFKLLQQAYQIAA